MARRRALFATALLHSALLGALWALPDPVRPAVEPPAPDLTDIELVTYVPIEPDPPAAGGVVAPPDDAASRGAGDEVAPNPAPARPAPSTRRGQTRPRTDQDAAPAIGEDVDAPDVDAPPAPPSEDDPTAGALELSGRRAARTSAGSISPRLPASARDALDASRGTRVARRGSKEGRSIVDPQPGAAIAQVKTPADAGFELDDDGRWVFHDPDPGATWSATLQPDGRLRFTDKLAPRLGADGGARAPGLKEWVLQGQGKKFWAKRKQRLLAATSEMRLQMAVSFAEKNIDRQLRRLSRELLEIWRSDAPPHRRRELIFQIWDDCEERVHVAASALEDDGQSEIDALRTRAGTEAWAAVVAFVRRHLPRGDPDAYPAAELARLNETRASKERFDPYG